jgi:hypothetical protein
MGKFIKHRSFKSFVKSVNESEDTEGLGYDPAEIKRRVSRAIIWLNIRLEEYAEPLSTVDIYGSSKINPKTMCTDGRRIIFHPEFVASQSDEAIRLVLAHELLHCIGEHPLRREGRDPLIWNYACDYAINPILQGEPGLEWPKNPDGSRMGLLEPKYDGMRPEDIYEEIKNDPKPPKPADLGHVEDEENDLPDPDPGLEVQIEEEEDDLEISGDDEDIIEGPYPADGSDGEEGEDEDQDEDSEDVESGENGEEDDNEDEDESSDDEETWKIKGDDDDEDGEPEEQPEWDGTEEDYPANVGDLVKGKDGKFGKITKVNPDGTYDIKEMTKKEVEADLFDDISPDINIL